MVKAKTSPKQKKSLKKIVKLKPNVNLTEWSPHTRLLNKEFVGQTLIECFINNDPDGIVEVLETYLEALQPVKKLKSKTTPGESTLSSNLKSKNPTIKTLTKLTHKKAHAILAKKK